MPKPTAIVYIDGLNLQRRLIDKVPGVKWVDYWHLAISVIPNFEVVKVHVFTSIPNAWDPKVAQEVWAKQSERAPNLSFHLGYVKRATRLYPLPESSTLETENGLVKVIKMEEKGSDVALASRLVMDANRGSAEIYFVVTSDTDFEPALRILKQELNVQIGLLITTDTLPKVFAKLEPNVIRHLKPKHVVKLSLD